MQRLPKGLKASQIKAIEEGAVRFGSPRAA
jgi:hypothetical protein